VLQQHVKDYKIDVKAQLDKETGLLVNFIQDLESKYKPQVEALSLTAFVEKLKPRTRKCARLRDSARTSVRQKRLARSKQREQRATMRTKCSCFT
ncbi:MAG: hypothetical protein K2F89_09810, partial [Treponemataceae bacterium]|nr:hypothetical protein [Treponemataceae bacterium]